MSITSLSWDYTSNGANPAGSTLPRLKVRKSDYRIVGASARL
jgi:hypothetical protein